MAFQEPQTSKSKVEIPSSELTSTDFKPRDLIFEVDEDIPTDDISISSQLEKIGTATHMKFHTLTMKREKPSVGEDMVHDIVDNVSSIDEKCPKNTNSNLKRPHQCDKCNRSFSNKANLELHLKTKDELTMCESCNFKSCTKLAFSHHMKKVHGPKLESILNQSGFKCPKCDQKFHSRLLLRSHEKTTKQDEHTCEDCGFKSCTYFGFLSHQKKVHGKKPEQRFSNAMSYNCTECDHKTNSKPNLDIHMKSKDEPTICEHCDFKSCTNHGVSLHMNKVHGIKHHMKKVKTESIPLNGFKCPKCDQKFHNRVNLQYHEKCKQEVQICEDCGFKSCTYLGFLSHLRKTHGKKSEKSNIKDDHNSNFGKPNIYNCIKCDQKFYSGANLESHVKKIRDEVLSCSNCDFKSCTKTGLLIHLRNVHDISSDAVENVPDGKMILDVLEQKQSIPMTTHGRFMVS